MVRSRGQLSQRRAPPRRALIAEGPDHLRYEVTIEDPKVFTAPWKMQMVLYRRKEPDVRLLDYEPVLLMQEQEK